MKKRTKNISQKKNYTTCYKRLLVYIFDEYTKKEVYCIYK